VAVFAASSTLNSLRAIPHDVASFFASLAGEYIFGASVKLASFNASWGRAAGLRLMRVGGRVKSSGGRELEDSNPLGERFVAVCIGRVVTSVVFCGSLHGGRVEMFYVSRETDGNG